jgi:hypothetical protein
MKRGHIAAAVAEASHSAPGRTVTADPAVLAAQTIAGVDIGAARRAAADFLSALGIDMDREEMRETPVAITVHEGKLVHAGESDGRRQAEELTSVTDLARDRCSWWSPSHPPRSPQAAVQGADGLDVSVVLLAPQRLPRQLRRVRSALCCARVAVLMRLPPG